MWSCSLSLRFVASFVVSFVVHSISTASNSPVLHPPSGSTVYNATAPIFVASPGSYTERFKAIPTFWGFSLTDNETHLGLQAAFHEANAEGGANGRPFEAVPVESYAGHISMKPQSDAVLRTMFYNMTNITAVAGSLVTIASVTLGLAQSSGVPLVGTRSTSLSAFSEGATAFLHVGTSFESEMMSLLNYAIHSRLKCKRFLFYHVLHAELVAVAKKMRDVIVRLGLPEPVFYQTTLVYDPKYAEWRANLPAIIDNMTFVPHGVFLLMDGFTGRHLVEVYHNSTRYNSDDLYFFTPLFASTHRYLDSNESPSSVFRHVYFSQPFPFADDRGFTLIQEYQAAMDGLQASGQHHVRMSGVPSFSSLDGYLSGRAIVATARTMQPGNMSAAAFKRRFFEQRMFDVGDSVFGPYSAGCVGQRESKIACWCNTGARTQYLVSVNATTGLQRGVRDDPTAGEDGVAELSTPLGQCGFSGDLLAPALVVPSLFDATYAASDAAFAFALQTSLLRGVTSELLRSNRVGATLGRGTVEAVRSNITNVTSADDRFSVFAAALSVASPDAHCGGPHLSFAPLPPHGRFADRDPDTVPFSAHEPNVLALFPTLADFLHTGAAYASSIGSAASVGLMCDTAVLCGLGRRSVESFGHRPAHTALFPSAVEDFTTLVAVRTAAQAVGANGVVLIATHRPAVVRGVAAAAQSGALGGATAVVCSSELVLYAALNGTGGVRVDVMAPPAAGGTVLFASGLPAGAGLPPGDGLSAYGQLVARAVVAVYAHDSPESGAAAASAAFRFGSLSSSGVVLEPLSRRSCGLKTPVYPHPGGDCQCTKGLNVFSLFAHNVNSTATTLSVSFDNAVFQYRHAECGVRYVPLPDEESSAVLTPALIAAVAVSAALVIAVVILLVVALRHLLNRRSTRYAPKNKRKPFAVVFTDIESSTTLWSFAPESMGEGLDEHHRVVRAMIQQHKGYEVKTIGDSFMVAFEDVTRAASFAIAVQLALHAAKWKTKRFDAAYDRFLLEKYPEIQRLSNEAELWRGLRVRIGIHYGCGTIVLDETTNGYDYYGTVVNTAARVEGVGHGGQVLLTYAALEAMDKSAVEAAVGATKVTLLGEQPLRGLPDDVALAQIVPVSLSSRQFPPLRLDVEVTAEESFSGESDSSRTKSNSYTAVRRATSENSPPSSRASCEVDSDIMEVAARRLARGAPPPMVLFVDCVVETLMAPESVSARTAAVKNWSRAWRLGKATSSELRRLLPLSASDLSRLRLSARVAEAMSAAGASVTTAGFVCPRRPSETPTGAAEIAADAPNPPTTLHLPGS